MLGSMQPNLLLSPSSKQTLAPSMTISNSSSLQQSTGLDDKSLKDIVDILNKRIENVKHLTEFSQTLLIENSSECDL